MQPTLPYLGNDDHSSSHHATVTTRPRTSTDEQPVQTPTRSESSQFRKNSSNHSYRDQGSKVNRQHDLNVEAEEARSPNRPRILPRLSSIGRRLSNVQDDPLLENSPPPKQSGPVSWADLPHKDQLAVLTMARLSEPLTQTSLSAYVYYQLKSFDQSLPASTIAFQSGLLTGGFTAAQFATAILWGRVADAEWGGRKRVLLIGLFGTGISIVGFGFSRSFWQAAFFRVLGGLLNGNVGVMRTMISEIIKEKKYQSRAFLLLPMCFNIGVIIGPVLGGLLADPVSSYPKLFGANSVFGGKDGVWWMKHWPYALPNLISAVFLLSACVAILLGLEETLDVLRDKPDIGIRIGQSIARLIKRLIGHGSHRYTAVDSHELDHSPESSYIDGNDEGSRASTTPPATPLTPLSPRIKRKLPFHRLWTRNVIFTFLCHGLVAFHIGTFSNLWYIFLSTPRFDPAAPIPPSHTSQSLPFAFTGGLGMPPRTVGLAMAILGAIGITLQLLVYPTVNHRLGTLRSFRYSLLLFPVAFCLVPYLAIVPSSTAPPTQASGFLVWLSLAGVLFIQVLARTFALPATAILVNNCSPHPSVLGTIHGIGQSVSSGTRTVGPVLGGWLFGLGLRKGVVGGVWWGLAAVATCAWLASGLIYEGSGHEIWLEGEKEEMGDGRD